VVSFARGVRGGSRKLALEEFFDLIKPKKSFSV
jgi:hypothetical protein